jgi:hypothetical protein
VQRNFHQVRKLEKQWAMERSMHARCRQTPALCAEPTADVEAYRLARLAQAERFYAEVLSDLLEARIQFLVGGNLYTSGARCPTKDLDFFRSSRPRVEEDVPALALNCRTPPPTGIFAQHRMRERPAANGRA